MTSIDADRIAAEKLLQTDQLLDALSIYNNLIGKNPADVQAWVGMGMVMVRTLQWEQAGETFKFVLQLDPGNALAMYGLSGVLFQQGDRQAAAEMVDSAYRALPGDWRIGQARALFHSEVETDPVRKLAFFKEWGRKFADPLTDKARPLPALTLEQKNPKRRLKVGYVSGDLRQHAVAFFMEPIFANHNPEKVNVFVYSTCAQRDAYTERIAANVPNWFDVHAMGDEDLFDLIRQHKIDVLIDLSGHTVGHRLFVFARRAAPVQVTWMGFMAPLGMKAMDYRLTDASLSPLGAELHSSEQLFRLSQTFCYIPPADSPEVDEPPLVKRGHPTLISLNNSKKITNEMLVIWREILMRRSEAHLIVMSQEIEQAQAQAQMLPRLERLGFPMDRVQISKQLPINRFMALGGVADVALDTSPISGGTTTMHTLWMGLPVVALEGVDESSGYTASILRRLGCGNEVARDGESYIRTALALMEDVERLTVHRHEIRDRMRASPVMNYVEYTEELEQAYRLLWINHLLGEPRYLDTQCDLEMAMKAAQTTNAPLV